MVDSAPTFKRPHRQNSSNSRSLSVAAFNSSTKNSTRSSGSWIGRLSRISLQLAAELRHPRVPNRVAAQTWVCATELRLRKIAAISPPIKTVAARARAKPPTRL